MWWYPFIVLLMICAYVAWVVIVTISCAKFFMWLAYDRHGPARFMNPKPHDIYVYFLGVPAVVVGSLLPIFLLFAAIASDCC